MASSQQDQELALKVIEATVEHARRMLASQLRLVQRERYDFLPAFEEMSTRLYLVGVMWKFGEQFELPTAPRERAFLCLMSLLSADGVGEAEIHEKVPHLHQVSTTTGGQTNAVVAAGYAAAEGDGSLSQVFETFRNSPEVSGAPYRMLDRSKPVAAILAVASAAIALLLGTTVLAALGVGLVFGVSTLAVALVVYKQSIKMKRT
jgi:hypothetical protein